MREDADSGSGRPAGTAANQQPPTETVNLRIPSGELARLDLLLADVRGRAGVFVGRSGVVRALVNWLAEVNVGLRGIRTGADLERRLMRLVSRESPEGEKGPDGGGGGSHS